jgi:hypothetical protein
MVRRKPESELRVAFLAEWPSFYSSDLMTFDCSDHLILPVVLGFGSSFRTPHSEIRITIKKEFIVRNS